MTKKEQQKRKAKDLRLRKTYGITIEEFEEMLKAQSNGCWICSRQTGRLCVDHRHVTKYKSLSTEQKKKEVRGILCFLCNVGLKGFEKTNSGSENRKRLEGTYKYFQKWKLKGEI